VHYKQRAGSKIDYAFFDSESAYFWDRDMLEKLRPAAEVQRRE
jgi:hypothetical protein